MIARTILQIELVGQVIAALVFLALFLRPSSRPGLWDAHPGVRGAARHILAVTAVTVGEKTILMLILLGVPIPISVILVAYAVGLLVVMHRIYLVLRPRTRLPASER